MKLSKDWNKNLELSRRAFAVKLPKGWMEQALEEQRQRRLERDSTGAVRQRRDRRRDAGCALLLPPAWEKLPPQELVSNLCSSAQASKLSSEAKEKLEGDLTDRLLRNVTDQQDSAVRLDKGWARHLPPLPKAVENSRLPARLVLPADWKEKEVESVAAELGVTLPPEQEENRVLPRNWATDLHSDGETTKGGKTRKHGEGSVKKKKSEETSKRTQLKKNSKERRRGKPKKARVEQESKPDLCEYELIRLENIRQREELFAELNLGEAKASVMQSKGTKSKKVKGSNSEKARGTKSAKKGEKSEQEKVTKELPAEVRRQLEKPALEGWKREVVMSKVKFLSSLFLAVY